MKANTKKLISLIFSDKKNLSIMVFFGLIQTVATTATPYLLKIIVERIAGHNMSDLLYAIIVFFSIGVIMYLSPIFVDRYYTKLGSNMAFKLQSEVLKKFYSSRLDFLNIYSISELLRITISDVEEFKRNASYLIWAVFHFIVQFIALIFYVSLINPVVLIVLFAWYFLFFFVTGKLSHKVTTTRTEERKVYGRYISVLKDSIQGNTDLRFLGSYSIVIKKLSDIFGKHLKVNLKAMKAQGVYNYLTNICQSVADILLIVMIFALKGKYQIDPLSALVLFSYTFFMFPIVAQLFTLKGSYSRINGLLSSIYSVLDDNQNDYVSGNTKITGVDKIRFNDSVVFQKGRIYILKGISGCGKTTFIKKLLKLIRSDMEIKVNDINIDDIEIESYHKRISFIPQDVYLFDSTIYENIKFNFSQEYDKEKINELISLFKLNNISDRIQDASGESGNEKISGGEKKRLGIARAIIESEDKDLFIFDETFSNIDSETKEEILTGLGENYFNNKITLIVTHDNEIEKIINMLSHSVKSEVIDFNLLSEKIW